jgi:hypothetical protein
MPGFFNHKYRPGPMVSVEYAPGRRVFNPRDFPLQQKAGALPAPDSPNHRSRHSSDVLDRARRYIATIPPAVEGNHGDAATFRVCCRLVRGFALGDDEALSVLASWNGACLPPWSEEELRAKLAGARRYGREPVGGLIESATRRRTS